jgi:hypothetical protein
MTTLPLRLQISVFGVIRHLKPRVFLQPSCIHVVRGYGYDPVGASLFCRRLSLLCSRHDDVCIELAKKFTFHGMDDLLHTLMSTAANSDAALARWVTSKKW